MITAVAAISSAVAVAALYACWRRLRPPGSLESEQLLELTDLTMKVLPCNLASRRASGEPVDIHQYVVEAMESLALPSLTEASLAETSESGSAPDRRSRRGSSTPDRNVHRGSSVKLLLNKGFKGPSPADPLKDELNLSKFAASLEDLVVGEPQEAALGVVHLMPAEVRAGMMRGIAEIEAEFEAFRTIVREYDAGGETRPWWATVELAEEACECMRYCLHETAGSSDKLFSNSPFPRDHDANGVRVDRRTANGAMMSLRDFCTLPEAQTAKLEVAGVAALRIYTTAAFKVLNGPLRQPWASMPHPFPTTICFLSDAIGKLRAVSAQQEHAHMEYDLWRGLQNRKTTESFEAKGGTEMAPMSTTSDIKVGLRYTFGAQDTASALLFKLRTDSFMARGASLSWVSAFPGEEEVLFPPLTYLKPSRKQVERISYNGRVITVIEVVPVVSGVL